VRGVDDLGNEYYAYNWIRWAPNPLNAQQGITVKGYNIYRKGSGQPDDQYALWKAEDAAVSSSEDHSAEIRRQSLFDYALTAVGSDGEESVMAEAQKFSTSVAGLPGRHLKDERPK